MKRIVLLIFAALGTLTLVGCVNTPGGKTSEVTDLPPMVMVNGTLYYDTGKESTVDGRCGVMDGEITSAVDGTEIPSENDQSNFGTEYGYQYTGEGQIEIYMNEKWMVFKQKE